MVALDIVRLRADTPACDTLIHFNNAGASLMPTPVYRATLDHLALEQGIGGYEAEAAADPALEDFYDAFGALLSCDRSEIAYVENATRAWDMAFYSLPLQAGDRILTAEAEYVSNFLGFLHQAKRRGLEIDVTPSDASGQLDLDAMERMVTPRTKLIAITHIPTQGGLVNPAEEVGRIARNHGITYLLDACQSAGQMPLDVRTIGCQLLSGTGRAGRAALAFSMSPRRSSIGSIRPSSTCTRPIGPMRAASSFAPTPGGSRIGKASSPAGSGCARPCAMRSTSASTRSVRA